MRVPGDAMPRPIRMHHQHPIDPCSDRRPAIYPARCGTRLAYPDPQLRPCTIDVLSNDRFKGGYTGGRSHGRRNRSGQRTGSVQNGRVVFNPASAGAHTPRYTVDGQYRKRYQFGLKMLRTPTTPSWTKTPTEGHRSLRQRFLHQLPPYSYSGPRILTCVTQSVHGGTVTIGASRVLYTDRAIGEPWLIARYVERHDREQIGRTVDERPINVF
jgi:hypothetical protein